MTSDRESQLLSRSLEYVVLESLVSIILSVSAIVGNILVIAAVYRNPRLRKMSNIYIVCLALTDLFMGVFVFPIVVVTLIGGNFPGGQGLCWFQAVVSPFLLLTSLLTMVMIAVQRYYKIVRPNKYRSIFTHRLIALTIAVVWSASAVLSVIFAAVGSRVVYFYEQFPICLTIMNKITLYVGFYLISLLLPFLVMSLLYFKIWRFIKSHNAQLSHSNVNAEEVKLTKSLCIVLGAFAACYTPFALAMGHLELYHNGQLPRQLYFFSMFMVAFASVVNPIIYGVMNREFRREFLRMICYPWKSRIATGVEVAA